MLGELLFCGYHKMTRMFLKNPLKVGYSNLAFAANKGLKAALRMWTHPEYMVYYLTHSQNQNRPKSQNTFPNFGYVVQNC